jgi:alkylation response protein AidB-like acyl-CoA dehydrogenase
VTLLYSEPERGLADALTDLLSRRSQWDDVLNGRVGPELWRAVGTEIGCAGLLIPESLGGAEASFREAAVAAEQLGGFVAPVPFIGSAVVATTALINIVKPDDLIKGLADGTFTATLAVPYVTGPGAAFPADIRISGSRSGDDAGVTRPRGTVRGVADALVGSADVKGTAGAQIADVLLVPAEGVPRGLYVVETSAPGVKLTPVTSLDMTRQLVDITLDGAPGRVIASRTDAEDAIEAALSAGAAAVAAEQLGLAQRCLDITVSYVKERHQFGRPVGSFQALKHRLADVWVAVTQARAPRTGTRRTAWHPGARTQRSPSRSPSRAARRPPCTRPRNACSSMVASASPGNTRPTCTSSAPRPPPLPTAPPPPTAHA